MIFSEFPLIIAVALPSALTAVPPSVGVTPPKSKVRNVPSVE